MNKYEINTLYKDTFVNFILNIKNNFNENKTIIHKARNELKIINYEKTDIVVKSFKIPHIINRIVYTFFKDSKAKKSYNYALKIGDFTPKPIGYIEFFTFGLLQKSYFLAEKFSYDFTIREPLLDKNFSNREEVFKAFARFTFSLHEANIFHQDYSPGNILIKQVDDDFIFKIVDINRMQFISLSLPERLQNFSKLWASDDDLTIIIKEYAHCMSEDEEKFIQMALLYSQKHKAKINMKKRLKGVKVVD